MSESETKNTETTSGSELEELPCSTVAAIEALERMASQHIETAGRLSAMNYRGGEAITYRHEAERLANLIKELGSSNVKHEGQA